MIEKAEILNVRLPLEIIKWIDSLVKEGIYKTRSEAIRDFSREYVQKERGKIND